MEKKILGIVGSYRKGGVIDTLVSEVLASAQEQGALISKIYLKDSHIFIVFRAFCHVSYLPLFPVKGAYFFQMC